ncbi:CUB and sushi domain-containing protein 2-like isoform X2 [Anneissia japonica]|uniref:CUB and sushi domain-containing protein 2-like isoform X2 n=1 Tax=Anneissia japonica TaxID=1529436 RepID=UPI001425776A|nr:CUB and sushi domain-containing protein 2-like isoform X2 [Anneissia japonica]
MSICENGAWSHTDDPECAIRCPVLEAPENGVMIGDKFYRQQVLLFSCNEGYKLSGSRRRVCNGAGRWSGKEASCSLLVTCPEIFAPENGNIEGDKFFLNQVVTFTCDEGFILKGSQRRRCNATGQWTGIETYCVDPNKSPCVLPLPQTAVIILTSTGEIIDPEVQRRVDHGTQVEFRCAYPETYTLVSESTSVCSNADWSHTTNPRCVIRCPEIFAPENGSIEGDKFYLNQVVRFTCDEGFNLKGSRQRRCNATGNWTGIETYCMDPNKSPCIVPRPQTDVVIALSSGEVIDPAITRRVDHGTRLEFKCLFPEQFALTSEESSMCNNGDWTHTSTPRCVIKCPELYPPTNGKIIGDRFYLNQVVRFTCNENFVLVGSSQRRCASTGEWTGGETSCRDVNKGPCVVPRLGNQVIMVTTSGEIVDRAQQPRVDHGTVVEFRCEDPATHTLVTEPTSICDNGSWSHSENPKCFINCPILEAPENGVIIGDKFYRQQVLRFSCNDGYKLSGSSRRVCTGTGEWSGKDASCSSIIDTSCGDPGDIVNGERSGNNFNIQDTVTYTCNEGFTLLGSSTLMCLPILRWSNEAPTCVKVDECRIPAIDNADATVYSPFSYGIPVGKGSIVSVGSILLVRCRSGYIVKSVTPGTVQIATCTYTGWNRTILSCA